MHDLHLAPLVLCEDEENCHFSIYETFLRQVNPGFFERDQNQRQCDNEADNSMKSFNPEAGTATVEMRRVSGSSEAGLATGFACVHPTSAQTPAWTYSNIWTCQQAPMTPTASSR